MKAKEEKELLLKDLCARLCYGVKVQYKGNLYDLTEMHKDGRTYLGSYNSIYGNWHCSLKFEDYPKPYLRSMSSMTEEECDMVEEILGDKCIFDFMGNGDIILKQGQFSQNKLAKLYDYYNSIHVDYRGLIEKGLAVKVTAENNPYK